MKTKITAIILLLAAITSICGCQSNSVTASSDNSSEAIKQNASPSENNSATEIKIEKNNDGGFIVLTSDSTLITSEQFDYMYNESFGELIVSDTNLILAVDELVSEHSELTEAMYTAACGPAETDQWNIGNDERNEWFEISNDKASPLLTDLEAFYAKQKSLYNDIDNYDDFCDKFSFMKAEDGKLYFKGYAIGKHASADKYDYFFNLSDGLSYADLNKAIVIKTDGVVKIAYPIINYGASEESKILISFNTVDLEEKDGKYRIVRNLEWSRAYGNGGK